MAQHHASTTRRLKAAGTIFFVATGIGLAQSASTVAVRLQADAGTPVRVYVTDRVWFRKNRIVHAKVAEAVWAFDRVVIPIGAELEGRVVELQPVPRMARVHAIVSGDFTPLKNAAIAFTSIRFPDGRLMAIQTDAAFGLKTIYVPPRPGQKAAAPESTHDGFVRHWIGIGRQQARAQVTGIYDQVRGTNKVEWAEEFLLAKLPYHPQWYRRRTRFDPVLRQPLKFGTADVPSSELANLGALPAPDSVAQMRLLSAMASSTSHNGDKMSGVISEPIFSNDHKLLFPQGTEVTGKVTLAQRARFFHRGGKLRFAFEEVRIPHQDELAAESQPPADIPARAQLAAAEGDPNTLAVDSEGTAKATESKTRFLRPAVAFLVASKSADNDAGRQGASGGASANGGGRGLGGFSGFGILGIVASRGPVQIGEALGFYGLAWSVFSNVVSRGQDVKFEPNTAVAIRFGSPPRKPAK